MNLIKNVLKSPMKTSVATVAAVAVSHFLLGLDLIFTGGIGAVGVYFVVKAL